ncbi:MAG: WhiB family transcriptional regulator [Mycobacterium sp.]
MPSRQLSGPLAGIWDWQLRGLCRGTDASMFFTPGDIRGHERVRREARAKEMCLRCPVIAECRVHALNAGESYGIWGGLSASERTATLHATVGENVSTVGVASP